jgi:proteasome lid subunit RPN8/RPN11
MLILPKELHERIKVHVEAAYPEEGAGFLLGVDGEVKQIHPLPNAREDAARRNRFLITPGDYLKAELAADRLGLSLIGVFHSHPDCPNVPSEYDREWAQPFFSYVITRVEKGRAVNSRSWRLVEDRSKFIEEKIKQDSEMTSQTLQKVDHSALKTNQLFIIVLSVLAFILNLPILAAFVALMMGIGSALKVPGFGFVYKSVLKPRGWIKPDVLDDNPEPHRFAQTLGFLFMIAGSAALFAGLSELGWSLVWLVVALAALNAFGGFCVGCAVYYWLGRFGITGFDKRPPAGTLPGMKPGLKANI